MYKNYKDKDKLQSEDQFLMKVGYYVMLYGSQEACVLLRKCIRFKMFKNLWKYVHTQIQHMC